jgi:hypothetical protein
LIYLIEFLFFSPPPTYIGGAYDYSPARALLGAFFIFIFIFDFFGTPTYLCGVYDYSPARALLVARIQPHFSPAPAPPALSPTPLPTAASSRQCTFVPLTQALLY